jgi:hypothetical protein
MLNYQRIYYVYTCRMVESLNNGMFTIYQLVQDFATIHSILRIYRKNDKKVEAQNFDNPSTQPEPIFELGNMEIKA